VRPVSDHLVRRQLGHWAARYRALAAAVVVAAVVVVAFPSVAPRVRGFDQATAPAAPAPDLVTPSTRPPTIAGGPLLAGPLPPAQSGGVTAGPPGAIADPPAPPDRAVPCPIDLPAGESATQALPLADVLNLLSPALPLLGPFIPFALAGLPVAGPVLTIATPLLPVGQPVFVFLGPLAARTVGPLASYEAILLEPVAGPIRDATPQALEAQQAFLAQLQPAIDQVTASGIPTCGAIVVGTLAGIAQQAILDLGLDDLLQTVLRSLT
jgi:hypothetical protein